MSTESNIVRNTDSASVWHAAPPDPSLSDDEVHVWRAWLDVSASRLQRLLATLSADERQRHGRFHFQKDRDHFAVGRGFLRTTLSRYLKLEPAQLNFVYGQQGKPALTTGAGDRPGAHVQSHDALRFNLSHSGGIALLAIATGRDVGVDVEFMSAQVTTDEVAERFFSPHEVATLRTLPREIRRTAFFKCWTRKEAFIKAKGGGLSIPLDQFDVAFAPAQTPALLRTQWNPREASCWSMFDLNVEAADYAAALVVEGTPRQLSCWQFDDDH